MWNYILHSYIKSILKTYDIKKLAFVCFHAVYLYDCPPKTLNVSTNTFAAVYKTLRLS